MQVESRHLGGDPTEDGDVPVRNAHVPLRVEVQAKAHERHDHDGHDDADPEQKPSGGEPARSRRPPNGSRRDRLSRGCCLPVGPPRGGVVGEVEDHDGGVVHAARLVGHPDQPLCRLLGPHHGGVIRSPPLE